MQQPLMERAEMSELGLFQFPRPEITFGQGDDGLRVSNYECIKMHSHLTRDAHHHLSVLCMQTDYYSILLI